MPVAPWAAATGAAAGQRSESPLHFDKGISPLAGSVDMTWVELGQRQRTASASGAAPGPGTVSRNRTRPPVTGSVTDEVNAEHLDPSVSVGDRGSDSELHHSRASRTTAPPTMVAWASSPRKDHSPSEQRPHDGQDARRTMGCSDRRSGRTTERVASALRQGDISTRRLGRYDMGGVGPASADSVSGRGSAGARHGLREPDTTTGHGVGHGPSRTGRPGAAAAAGTATGAAPGPGTVSGNRTRPPVTGSVTDRAAPEDQELRQRQGQGQRQASGLAESPQSPATTWVHHGDLRGVHAES
jgi:hypothetical protein